MNLSLNIWGAIANILGDTNISFADEVIGNYTSEEVDTHINRAITHKEYVDVEICVGNSSFVEEFRVWAHEDVVTRVRHLINIDEDGDKEYTFYTIEEGLIPVKE